MTTPPLTTVNQKIDTTSATAAEILLAQLDAPPRAKPSGRMITGGLGVREPTGPARTAQAGAGAREAQWPCEARKDFAREATWSQ